MLLVHRVIPPRAASARPPLLLLLHGIGADEEDLLPLAGLVDPRFLVLAVRAPHEAEPMGHRWYRIDWSVSPPRADAAEIVASRDLLARFVEEASAAYGADPARTFLLGFSQGAIMALALLQARPDLVRGVVAHSGRLVRLPGQADAAPESLARAEVLVLHGGRDDVVPVAQGRKIHEVLSRALGARATYREFETLGHGISDESARAAAAWLERALGPPR
jgi:phospholipase/carboxylesterase